MEVHFFFFFFFNPTSSVTAKWFWPNVKDVLRKKINKNNENTNVNRNKFIGLACGDLRTSRIM